MKREIIFRALSTFGIWIYGTPVFYKSGEVAIYQEFPEYGSEVTNMLSRHNVNPNTLGEFIGLSDRVGRKIYEGDIIKFDWRRHKKIPINETTQLKVFFAEVFQSEHSTGFFISKNKEQSELKYNEMTLLTKYRAITHCEVIGNIHINPELL